VAAEVEGPVAEEWDCGTTSPPSEALVPLYLFAVERSSSFLRASVASLLLAIPMSDWF
jgi:hypothetical protein